MATTAVSLAKVAVVQILVMSTSLQCIAGIITV
jgi:hypothetical protein